MKYTFSSEVNISLKPEEFKLMFKGLDPQDPKAEEMVKQFAQNIIDSYLAGKLMTQEKHNALQSEAMSEAANDFRFRHGPGGC